MGKVINREFILGLPVICEQTGKRLGIVENILYEPDSNKVKGIMVARTGYKTRIFAISLDKIYAFGEFAVIVEDDCIEDMGKKGERDIIGRTIISDDGQELGMISDVIFNSEDGEIEGYEISKGIVDDLIAGRNVLSGDILPYSDGDVIVIPMEQGIEMKSNNRGIMNILSNKGEY